MTRVARGLRGAGVVGVVLGLAACVTAPAGPTLPAMPGSRKSADQFTADDVRCRAVVHERLAGVTPSSAANQTVAGSAPSQSAWIGTQQQFDSVYYACMYASGHKVPVPAYDTARYRAWYDSLTPSFSAAVPPPPNTAPPSAPTHN